MKYLQATDLSFAYEQEEVLTDVNFTLSSGEFVILTGENGAAKSTLIRIVLGLLKQKTGDVKWSKENIKGNKLSIGYVPQNVSAFNAGFPSTVQKLVESGRYSQRGWFQKLTAKDYQHVDKALESVGMENYRHQRIGDLSGGQKQRISLARIFAMDPDVFILDEPTTGMDIASRTSFYQLLEHQVKVHDKTILMVTHEDNLLKDYETRNIHLVREERVPWRCFSLISSNEH